MINYGRLAGFLMTGVLPEATALDEAIERENALHGISDELIDEILEFLGGGTVAGRGGVSDVEDAAGGSMAEHDVTFHPDGFDPKTDTCKLRDQFNAEAKPDADLTGSETANVPKSTLSNRKRKEYGDLMRRKHPDIDADKLLEELGKIGDRKIQGDAFRWAMKGAARLPEDLYKVENARKMADKAKVDPLSYNTPQACIDALTGKVEVKEEAIDPDTVPELKNKQVLPMGVTVYEVDESGFVNVNGSARPTGQVAMRKIINTHWGKDANPWCLLRGDGEGNLAEDAIQYWNHYSALPKKVAFKDGKLLAFMATDQEELPSEEEEERYNEYLRDAPEWGRPMSFDSWLMHYYDEEHEIGEKWWDRQDKDHGGVPAGNAPIPNDKFGRWADFEIVDGRPQEVGGFKKGDYGKPGYMTWHTNGNVQTAYDGDKWYAFLEDGTLATASTSDDIFGDRINFNKDGSCAGRFKGGVRREDPSEEELDRIRAQAARLSWKQG